MLTGGHHPSSPLPPAPKLLCNCHAPPTPPPLLSTSRDQKAACLVGKCVSTCVFGGYGPPGVPNSPLLNLTFIVEYF
ncbi:hypothetical protein C2845_PM13G13260 [Panicum miliaceum]|uniref:Uncharacterized protein n=1 Tax=Panicum miliaceum TaxID=4540 RepID=A0A3L6RG16_PANMI|nr:hypothetical protein C2845_PM13G13260 [Panicum miliaceum]